MGYDKNKVIEVATSQIGYHEKASGSNLDSNTGNSGSANWTKYARDLDALRGFYNGRKNGFAWCDVFVDWCFVQAYGRQAAQLLLCQPDNSAGAGCQYSAEYFNAKGQFHKSGPQTSDQIFFGSAWNNVWHTGIVVAVSESYVTTVEGNSSDRVQKCTYRISDPNIWGYGRPDWGEQAETDSERPQEHSESPVAQVKMYNVKLPLLMIGDTGGYVKAAQTLLIAHGYDCGNKPLFGIEKADGEFGRTTERSVGFFQSKHGLEVDGIIGGATWAALLKFD